MSLFPNTALTPAGRMATVGRERGGEEPASLGTPLPEAWRPVGRTVAPALP